MASVFTMLKKSLSGEKPELDQDVESEVQDSVDQSSDVDLEQDLEHERKKGKRYRSGDVGERMKEHNCDQSTIQASKKPKIGRQRQISKTWQSTDHEDKAAPVVVPKETPEWGVKLFELLETMREEIRSVSQQSNAVNSTVTSNNKDLRLVEKKLAKVEKQNANLETENVQLREKLLDLEYQQRKNNLIFGGIFDGQNESDLNCISKVRFILKDIPGLDSQQFRIDKCYRLDGTYKEGQTRRILCTFNWAYEVQCVLRNRKKLPRGVFVNEDLPEEWVDRRKILKPIFNAAKKVDKLRSGMKLVKDRLTIDGRTYTVAPVNNVYDVNAIIDLPATCQRFDDQTGTLLFFGSHSPYSNLYPCSFVLDNVKYNSVEQYLQSEKAKLFDDDVVAAKIMKEPNPYKIKKLGSKIKKFNVQKWKSVKKQVAYKAVLAKFGQNKTLHDILLANDHQIAESSENTFWGTGVHLHDRTALDKRAWKTTDGGVMCQLFARVCQELRQN